MLILVALVSLVIHFVRGSWYSAPEERGGKDFLSGCCFFFAPQGRQICSPPRKRWDNGGERSSPGRGERSPPRVVSPRFGAGLSVPQGSHRLRGGLQIYRPCGAKKKQLQRGNVLSTPFLWGAVLRSSNRRRASHKTRQGRAKKHAPLYIGSFSGHLLRRAAFWKNGSP